MKKFNSMISRYTLLMILAISAGRAYAADQSALAKLETTTQKFMNSLREYRQCAMSGTCTPEQKRILRTLAGSIATLTVAAIAAALVGGSRKQGALKQQVAVLEQEKQKLQAEIQARSIPQEQQQLDNKFSIAVLQKNILLATEFLKKGASPDAQYGDDSILEWVVHMKQYEEVSWLLDQGATPYVREDILEGSTSEIKGLIQKAQTPFLKHR